MNTFDEINRAEMLPSLNLGIDTGKEKIPVITMQKVDVKALIEEDEKTTGDTLKPFRFGYEIDADIDIKKDGLQKEFHNGDKLWLLKIHSKGAFSINLIYDNFKLSKGSAFFIYNEDKTEILGAFTPELCNNKDNVFATGLVQGDTIILEYYEPESANGVIHINKVIHGYRLLNDSASCNIDVMCTLGDDWRNEIRAVCLIIIGGGAGSGCLINNTSKDFKPYILTARHNFFDDTNTGSTPNRSPGTSVFRFKFWKPNCGSGTPSTPYQEHNGAYLRAQYRPTDFALLELTSRPNIPNLYCAGWDRTTTAASNATGIHHPRGDAMKICYSQNPATGVTWPGFSSPAGALDHWRVTFNQGIVQHGSSGSPLFNPSKRIVGQLHGYQNNICSQTDNNCFCNIQPRIGEYGKFDLSWTGGGTIATRLSDWLAPSSSGTAPNTLDGIDIPIYIFGESNILFFGTTYTLISPPPGTITWEVTGPFRLANTTDVSTYVTRTTNVTGSGTLTAKVGGVIVAQKAISASLLLVTGPDIVSPGQTYVPYYLPYEQGATYNWSSEQGFLTVVSNGSSTGAFDVPYGTSGNYDRIICNVTLNGATIPFYNKEVQIQ